MRECGCFTRVLYVVSYWTVVTYLGVVAQAQFTFTIMNLGTQLRYGTKA